MPQETNMAELLRLMQTMIIKVDDLATAMKEVKSDVRGLKSDVHGLKSDVHGLKSDVHGLKSDVHGLKSDVQGLKSDVHGLKSDFQGLKFDVRELKTSSVRFEGKLDVLSGQFRDVAGQTIKDTQRITSLEGRISTLESKSN